jgi:peroxiredoxin
MNTFRRGVLYLSALCLMPSTFVVAQGMLPGTKVTKPEPKSALPYLLIGQTISKDLSVIDEQGKVRSLLSFKAPNDILVLGFFSPGCEADNKIWHTQKLIYERYNDWRVAYLSVSLGHEDSLKGLKEAMQSAKLPYPAVRDDQQKVARKLHVTATPETVIIDEWGQVRYRGPSSLEKVQQALQAVISHIDAVPEPEPTIKEGCPLP